ncbi:hypothetical protein JCM10550A_22690 [Methanogenium cariaci]
MQSDARMVSLKFPVSIHDTFHREIKSALSRSDDTDKENGLHRCMAANQYIFTYQRRAKR